MSHQQIAVGRSALTAGTEDEHHLLSVAPDVAVKRTAIVNVAFLGLPGAEDRQWLLVDAGMPGSARSIQRAATARFGPASRPAAILLTHGHFDHVGALATLAEEWDAPIYAHPDEHPFLDGSRPYPPPNPHVGGGLMARLAPLYPRGPINVSRRLRPLPPGGLVPGTDTWRWLPTPGHSAGHVSFWREADRILVVGDAFITTRQESAYAVATQVPEMHGPPQYFTADWDQARESVHRLTLLTPEIVVTGHGPAMSGPDMRRALEALDAGFDEVARPHMARAGIR